MNEKFYVVATNSNGDVALLDECKTQFEADCMIKWHTSHSWLYADDVTLKVKSSTEFYN